MKKSEMKIVREYLNMKGNIFYGNTKIVNGNINEVCGEKYLCVFSNNQTYGRVFIIKNNKVLLSSFTNGSKLNGGKVIWSNVKRHKYARNLTIPYEIINDFFTWYERKIDIVNLIHLTNNV